MKKKISILALTALSLLGLNLYAANESVDHEQPIAQQEEKSVAQENQVSASADCEQAEEGNTTTAESSTDKTTESDLPA